MRLVSVRIQDFRCIEDSTEFPIKDVTCLVGKNESGKTAILKALYKLDPTSKARDGLRLPPTTQNGNGDRSSRFRITLLPSPLTGNWTLRMWPR